MNLRRMVPAIVAVAGMAWGALAGVSVTDVVAKQRYPWNGLVDITCKVSGINGTTNGLKLALSAVMPDTGRARAVSSFRIVREGADPADREVHTNGAYRLLWDAGSALGPVRFTNMVVRVTAAFEAHEKVQLWEGGPYWATVNVGAEKPHEYGLYFRWGDTVGYRRERDAWVASDGSSSNFSFEPGNAPTYGKSPAALQSQGWVVPKDGETVLAPEHDAAQVQWGGDWRMPTYQELYDLCYDKCDWSWTALNGVNGYVVRGRGGFADASIFLPCAGYGYGTSLLDAGSYGYHWSSVPDPAGSHSRYLYLFSDWHAMYYGQYRYLGFSIRPVQGFAE